MHSRRVYMRFASRLACWHDEFTDEHEHYQSAPALTSSTRYYAHPYSIFGIAVDRKQDAKCLFHQEKGTLQAP
ncbi:hypothetical protein ACOBR2_07515 [Telmatobacter bradus]|uniref:hypothetical protein n=1 Tax=Telmatobacter bradus TaxID=474953 RepID=UPI003B43D265